MISANGRDDRQIPTSLTLNPLLTVLDELMGEVQVHRSRIPVDAALKIRHSQLDVQNEVSPSQQEIDGSLRTATAMAMIWPMMGLSSK